MRPLNTLLSKKIHHGTSSAEAKVLHKHLHLRGGETQ